MVSTGPIIGLFLGTGFSFTSSKGGYPTTDEDLASELLEGLTQFMLLFPYMVPGAVSSQTPVYAFGESYGGAYVVSLAHVYLQQRYKIKEYTQKMFILAICLTLTLSSITLLSNKNLQEMN